jgi:hypothetical protein|tara:strand:+ start:493 stop:660 length:168 start_codon:yes stop_codon:yes gene_type:complete
MPNVMTPDGKTKKFDYTKQGKQQASKFTKQNPGSKMKNVLASREMNKGKSNGNSY